MKRKFLLLIFLVPLLSVVWTTAKAQHANAYAYYFKVKGTIQANRTLEVEYGLNSPANSVTFERNGCPIQVVTGSGSTTGTTAPTNSGPQAAWLRLDSNTNLVGSAAAPDITIVVDGKTGFSVNTAGQVTLSTTNQTGYHDFARFAFNFPMSVAVDKNINGPQAGQVFVMEGCGGVIATPSRTTTTGVWNLSPNNLDPISSPLKAITGGGFHATTLDYSPGRMTVAPDGTLFFADAANNHRGVWWIEPGAPVSAIDNTQVFTNTTDPTNPYTANPPVLSCVVAGEGQNQMLYTLECDASGGVTPVTAYGYTDYQYGGTTRIKRYVIPKDLGFGSGGATGMASSGRKLITQNYVRYNNTDGLLNSPTVDGREYATSMKAGKYGTKHLWVANRDNTTNAFYFFSDRDADAEAPTIIPYPSGSPAMSGNLKQSPSGVFAVSPDGTLLASAVYKRTWLNNPTVWSPCHYAGNSINIYKIVYDGNGNATGLTRYIDNIQYGTLDANAITDMDFDWGNNLHLVSFNSKRLAVFAINTGTSFRYTITAPIPATSSPAAAVSGTYYIPKGPSCGDKSFSSLFDACTAINAQNITGNVELIITESLVEERNVGIVNPTNYSITIKSATSQSLPSQGCTTDAKTITFPSLLNNGQNLNSDCANGSFGTGLCAKQGTDTAMPTQDLGPDGCFAIGCKHSSDGIIRWSGVNQSTQKITIENLKFKATNWNTNHQRNSVILIINDCNDITIQNCEIYKGLVLNGAHNYTYPSFQPRGNSYNDGIRIAGCFLRTEISSAYKVMPNKVTITKCKIENSNIDTPAGESHQGHGINCDMYYVINKYGTRDNIANATGGRTRVNLTVTNCSIKAKQAGICANYTTGAQIKYNTTIVGHRHGIHSGNSISPDISNNTNISAPIYPWGSNGIRITASTTGTKILDNGTIMGNADGNGIWVDSNSHNSEMTRNPIIEGGCGVRVENSNTTKISTSSNRIKGTSTHAIYCLNVDGAHVESNTLVDAAVSGAGIYMSNVNNAIIEKNATIRAESGHGIYLHKATNGPQVKDNTVAITGGGIYGDGINIDSGSQEPQIRNNKKIQGGRQGIRIEAFSNSGSPKITTPIIANNETILGAEDGIYMNAINGDVLVDQNTSITGTTKDGINMNDVTGKATITKNPILGGKYGIYANAVTGAALVDRNTSITGTTESGISLSSVTGKAKITNNPKITGGKNGIYMNVVSDSAFVHKNDGGDGIIGTNQNGIVMTSVATAKITENPIIQGAVAGFAYDGISITGGAGHEISKNSHNNGRITGGRRCINIANAVGTVLIKDNANITGPKDGIYMNNVTVKSTITENIIDMRSDNDGRGIYMNTVANPDVFINDIKVLQDGVYMTTNVTNPKVYRNGIAAGRDGVYMTNTVSSPDIYMNTIIAKQDGISMIGGVSNAYIHEHGEILKTEKRSEVGGTPVPGRIRGSRHGIRMDGVSGETRIHKNWISVGANDMTLSTDAGINAGVYGKANISGGVDVTGNRFFPLLTASTAGGEQGVTGVYIKKGQSWNVENNCFSGFGSIGGLVSDKASFRGVRIEGSAITPPPAPAPNPESQANFAPPTTYMSSPKFYVRQNTFYFPDQTHAGVPQKALRTNVADPTAGTVAAYCGIALDNGITRNDATAAPPVVGNAEIKNNLFVSREINVHNYAFVGNTGYPITKEDNNVFSTTASKRKPGFPLEADPNSSAADQSVLTNAKIAPSNITSNSALYKPSGLRTERGVSIGRRSPAHDSDENDNLWLSDLSLGTVIVVPRIETTTDKVMEDIEGTSRVSTLPYVPGKYPNMTGMTLAGAYTFDPYDVSGGDIFTDMGAVAVNGIRVVCLGNRITIYADKAIQSVKLYDVQGRIVTSELTSSNIHSLNAPGAGVYIVETQTVDGRNIQKAAVRF